MFTIEWERADYGRMFWGTPGGGSLLIGRVRWAGTGSWEATARVHGKDEKVGDFESPEAAITAVKRRYLRLIEDSI